MFNLVQRVILYYKIRVEHLSLTPHNNTFVGQASDNEVG